MAKADLNLALTDDGRQLRVALVGGGDTKASIFINASEVDQLIRLLAKQRMNMVEHVSSDRNAVNEVVFAEDPRSKVSKSPSEDTVVLSLRHPGLGWIDWRFSKVSLKSVMYDMLSALK